MRKVRVTAVCLGVFAIALPGLALAGTVSDSGTTVTYTSDPATQSNESLGYGVTGNVSFIGTEQGATASGNCTQGFSGDNDPNRAECPFAATLFVFNFLGFDDNLSPEGSIGGAAVEAHGGAGGDNMSGGPNNDKLFGDIGDDNLYGTAGNDQLDGAAGSDSLDDGAGDDTITGGPGGDTLKAGLGRDTYTGGDGTDNVDYRDRTAPVTVLLDNTASSGEAGEGDTLGPDVEEIATGSGNDRLVGVATTNGLHGGGGNDSITGGPNEQRIEGEEGDDTIDSRDGAFDSVDCGPGSDTVFADLGDSTTNCEVAPDVDGDGDPNETDCDDQNAAVHHGAGEVFGNAVDEDCTDGPGFFTVNSGVTFRAVPKLKPARARFIKLQVTNVLKGDRLEIRCKGKGCPFKLKKRTVAADSALLSILKLMKKRYLRKGAVLEVRILRPSFHTRIRRLKVLKGGDVTPSTVCVKVGETTTSPCPLG